MGVSITLDDSPRSPRRAQTFRPSCATRRDPTNALVERARFAAALLAHLEQRYDELHAHGFAPLRAAWESLSTLIGAQISVDGAAGRIEGIALGLDDDGALRVRLASGTEQRVVTGDVTVVGGYRR